MISSHPKQYEILAQSFLNGPHHAWIFYGPKGIGKESFAKEFGSTLLGSEFNDQVQEFIEAGIHPNFFHVTVGPDAQEILVDQIRHLKEFVQKTAADGGLKIVLINSLNALGENAANALLKMLEEPPEKTFFFLIAHPGKAILPTIRSRCMYLSFQNRLNERNDTIYQSIIAGRKSCFMDISEDEITVFLDDLVSILKELPNSSPPIHSFAQKIAKDPEKYDVFVEAVHWWMNQLIRYKMVDRASMPFAELFRAYQNTCNREILSMHTSIIQLLNWQKNLMLDKRHTILGVFFLCGHKNQKAG